MQQRGGMDEFDAGRELDMAIGGGGIADSRAAATVSSGRMRLPPAPTKWLASSGIKATGERMRARISRSTCAMSSAQSDSSGSRLGTLRLPSRETTVAMC